MASSTLHLLDASVLVIRLGDEWFGLPAPQVREIVRWREPTPVPGSPPALLGIFNLRGMILPLLDARLLLNLQQLPRGRGTRLVVIEAGEQAALLVDEVWDLIEAGEQEREPPPPGSSRFTGALLHSERGRVALLDPAVLFDVLRGS